MINFGGHSEFEVVIIGQQPWDVEIGSNSKDLALELSKKHRVLYVNSPLDRITLYREWKNPRVKKRRAIIKNKKIEIVKIQENLWNLYPDCMLESINWIGSNFIFDWANKYNNYKFAQSIKKALKLLGFSKFMLLNDNEMFKGFHLKEFLDPVLSIYYSRDNMVAVPYWRRHGLRLEPAIIAKYDLCITNSTYLTDYCRQFNTNSFYVGQGCDFKFFTGIPGPYPFAEKFSGPVIGYVGALESARLDQDIIAYLAKNKPDWTIIMVGPEDNAFKAGKLHSFKNIIFAGIKPMEMLADYIRIFDVCINPQLINEVTIGNYPRKIDEYLVMGKPVVVSATATMESFKDFVSLAKSKEDYLELIESVLRDDNAELQKARTEYALTHTWENSVDKIYRAIEKTISAHK
ncbi:glycosyltransferase [Pedobacter antarcticus]|uniref:glycosyltransferase n=1 Tax=Pedobacter antarcticus TaxID=34086 RepID=UPI000884DD15|nr:glycosyltransferase [Pedobacter antarcticus]SDM28033.1 Glycosyltransferase involved in cell wall bisynthesis [Pedobacter antarcticus]